MLIRSFFSSFTLFFFCLHGWTRFQFDCFDSKVRVISKIYDKHLTVITTALAWIFAMRARVDKFKISFRLLGFIINPSVVITDGQFEQLSSKESHSFIHFGIVLVFFCSTNVCFAVFPHQRWKLKEKYHFFKNILVQLFFAQNRMIKCRILYILTGEYDIITEFGLRKICTIFFIFFWNMKVWWHILRWRKLCDFQQYR